MTAPAPKLARVGERWLAPNGNTVRLITGEDRGGDKCACEGDHYPVMAGGMRWCPTYIADTYERIALYSEVERLLAALATAVNSYDMAYDRLAASEEEIARLTRELAERTRTSAKWHAVARKLLNRADVTLAVLEATEESYENRLAERTRERDGLKAALEEIAALGPLGEWVWSRGGVTFVQWKCSVCQRTYAAAGDCTTNGCPVVVARAALAPAPASETPGEAKTTERDVAGVPPPVPSPGPESTTGGQGEACGTCGVPCPCCAPKETS